MCSRVPAHEAIRSLHQPVRKALTKPNRCTADDWREQELRQLGDDVFSDFRDYRTQRHRLLAYPFLAVEHFLHRFPGDRAVAAVPDLHEEPHIRSPRFHDAETQYAETFLRALPECLQFDVRNEARAGQIADLFQNVALEQSRVTIVVIHAFVDVAEPHLVDGTEGFGERHHPYARPRLLQHLGEDESHRLFFFLLAGGR